MGLIECTSGASLWRGYDYYKGSKVKNFVQVNETQYSADVAGSGSTPYQVFIDTAHPRKSKCNCPHADGRRIICKHMMAVYFTAFPQEAKRIYDAMTAGQEEEEKREEELSNRLIEYVCKMKKSELQMELLQILFDGPEWQYDRFLEEHYIDCE